jgi:hypothetical protein
MEDADKSKRKSEAEIGTLRTKLLADAESEKQHAVELRRLAEQEVSMKRGYGCTVWKMMSL